MIHSGFRPINNNGDIHNLYSWRDTYVPYVGWEFSDTFAGAQNLYTFLVQRHTEGSNYGGSVSKIWNGVTTVALSGVNTGDLLFFDWQTNGHIDHVTMQVAYGTDTVHGTTGDLADQHTGPEYHDFWSKWNFNPNVATTRIYAMHIYPGN